jgi:uncharacterized hydrophobic protein (TIGR00271 family)
MEDAMLISLRNWLRQMTKGERFRQLRRPPVPPERLRQLQTELLDEATPDRPYFVLIIGSCIIATFGLLTNSAAVIIGAMIVAPLMLPIRALAFGALTGDVRLFRQSLGAVVLGTVGAVAIAMMLGVLVNLPSFGSEILARSRPTLLDLGIAIAAGAISAYAKWQPKISGTLAGTALPSAHAKRVRGCIDASHLCDWIGAFSLRWLTQSRRNIALLDKFARHHACLYANVSDHWLFSLTTRPQTAVLNACINGSIDGSIGNRICEIGATSSVGNELAKSITQPDCDLSASDLVEQRYELAHIAS